MENCFIEVLSKKVNILVGSLYRPPNTNETEFLETITKIMKLGKLEKKEVILGMDHNLDLLKSHKHRNTELFLEKIIDNGYLPLITKPSRITKNSSTLIDNILLSQGLQHDYDSGLLVNDSSDHLPCYARLGRVMPGLKEPVKIESKKLSDNVIDHIKKDLEQEKWLEIESMTANESFDYFHNKLTNSLDKHAPVRTKTFLKGRLDEPWVTNGLKHSMKKQQRLYRATLKGGNTLETVEKYKNYRNVLTKIKRHCKTEFFRLKCTEFKSNTRKLWKLVNTAIKK